MKPHHTLAALLLCAALSACSILPAREALDTYLLPTALQRQSVAVDATNWSLRVLRPASGSRLAGRRIVVIPDDRLISVYKGAAWSDPGPLLMRDRLVDAILSEGRIASVSSDERSLHAEIELDSDLRAFQSEYRNGTPVVVIRLDARLVRGDSRRIIASRSFSVEQTAATTSIEAVVDAFGAAADLIAVDIARWAAEHGTPAPATESLP
jgi:cholesterol transport system auxiliary component